MPGENTGAKSQWFWYGAEEEYPPSKDTDNFTAVANDNAGLGCADAGVSRPATAAPAGAKAAATIPLRQGAQQGGDRGGGRPRPDR